MIEDNKFKPIDNINLYGDGIGKVTLYDSSHANESEEQRIWTVTTIGTLAYGNEQAKNPERLYKQLQELKHESLWEMCRNAYGSFDIKSSMRCSPDKYTTNTDEGKYGVDVIAHKQNIACFRIKVPIFVARQFMRHRSFSYIEMSRRYTKDSKVPFEFFYPKGSFNDLEIAYMNEQWLMIYDAMIKNQNLHTQVASRFLPQTTYTEFYMMGEVEGLKNFFKLRLDSHAQAEIRELAESMLELLQQYQPELCDKLVDID